MDAILQTIIKSPKLPDYVEELKRVLEEEQVRRNDFYNWLDEDKRAEFIAGEVVIHSPARALHIWTLKKIARIIDDYVELHKIGTVFTEQALIRLQRSDMMPDLVFWKDKKFDDDTKIFPIPNFVVEVISKSTEKNDRVNKKAEYALNGIVEYWIIDPDLKSIEQYVLDEEEYKLREKLTHGTIRCEVLKGLEIELDQIFN